MIRNFRDRLKALIRDLGWGDGMLRVAARFLSSISDGKIELRKYYFVSQPVSAEPLLPANRGLSIVVKQTDRQHPLVRRFPRPPQVIAARFINGARCFLATKDDNFVGFLWLQQGSYLEDEVRCRFTPVPEQRAVWDFDVHVEPDHRSGLAFARLWDTANRFLREASIEWSVSRISAFNPESINSHSRLGAFPIGSACFINGRRWQILLSGMSPYFHLSMDEKNVPEILLKADPSHRKSYSRFLSKTSSGAIGQKA